MTFLNKAKNTLIGDKAFYSKVFAIVFPMIIQNTVTNVVSLVDNIMVGRVGTLEMSSVAIVNQLIFVFSLCIFGGLAGVGIFSTQYAGASDNKGMRYCMRLKWYVAIIMLIAAFAVFLIFPDELISSYLAKGTAQEDIYATLKFGKDYLTVMLFGLLPFAVSQVYSGMLREVGETRLPMISSVVAIIVNMSFNYVLIFGVGKIPALGVVGAAIATVLSRYTEAVIIVIFAHKNKERFAFIKGVYHSFKIPFSLCKKIIPSGAPLLINEFLWSMGQAILLQCYSVRSLTVVAALNISNTAANLFNVAFFSMGGAIAIMLGQYLGAGDTKKAKENVWKLLFISVVVSIVMGTLLALCSGVIPKIYNTEEAVRNMARQFLIIVSVLMPVFAFSHGCYFAIRSGGRTIVTFLFDSAVIWIVNIPTAYLLSVFTSINIVTVFLLVQCIDIIKCILGAILVKKGIWIRNIVN